MPKTIISALRIWSNRLLLKRRNVVIHHSTVFYNVEFRGCAVIEPYCRLIGLPEILVGDNFYMNSGCHLLGSIIFGNDVMVGPKTVIWARDHGTEVGKLMRVQAHRSAPVRIGNDVWIGANVTILKGITIGNGAVIGAAAVVTKDVPDNAIVVGNPARVVRYREHKELL